MAFIEPSDLAASLPDVDPVRLDEVIADAVAFARVYAPCIDSDAFKANAAKVAALKAILRKAIVYDIEAGSGAVTQQTAGPFSQSVDTTQRASSTFFSKAQQDALRALCRGNTAVSGVYTIALGQPDTFPRY